MKETQQAQSNNGWWKICFEFLSLPLRTSLSLSHSLSLILLPLLLFCFPFYFLDKNDDGRLFLWIKRGLGQTWDSNQSKQKTDFERKSSKRKYERGKEGGKGKKERVRKGQRRSFDGGERVKEKGRKEKEFSCEIHWDSVLADHAYKLSYFFTSYPFLTQPLFYNAAAAAAADSVSKIAQKRIKKEKERERSFFNQFFNRCRHSVRSL